MFPHTVTVFNIVKTGANDIAYNRKVVDNVFFYTKKIISQEGKGEKYTYAYNVIFSSEAIKFFLPIKDYELLENKSDYFTLKENDIIVLGIFNNINNLVDIQKSNSDYFLIKTISDNRYGDEELQNIEVTN